MLKIIVSKMLQKCVKKITKSVDFFFEIYYSNIKFGKTILEELTLAVGDIIVGIDIGSSKVSLLVGEVNNFNQIDIIQTSNQKCEGIKKGKIIDEDAIVDSITKAMEDVEKESEIKINSAYFTIQGKYVTIVQNSVTKEVRDKYTGVTIKDVAAALQQVKDIDMPEGKTIIDIVTEQFVLNDGRVVEDPVGNLVNSFSVDAQVILADKEIIKQITSICRKCDLEIDGIIPITLAERKLVLDTNELNDNVMIVDIGAGNTEIGVFKGSSFVYSNTIPLGGDSITNDIKLVLNISEEEAERLKRQYGLAMRSYIDNDNDIVLNTCADSKNKIIKSSELIEIIEARVEEIFSLINKDITQQGIKSKINNVVLTGRGITNISKSDVAGKVILNIPVKFATGRQTSIVKPAERTAYSLVKYIASRPFAKSVSSKIDSNTNDNFFGKVLDRIKEFFYS